MAHYATTISSHLTPGDAFAYLADFTNTRHWDPSVRSATRVDGGDVGQGSAFDLVVRFGSRDVELRYVIVTYEPPQLVVLEARGNGFDARDAVKVSGTTGGALVEYDARLSFKGLRKLLDPLMQVLFSRTSEKAIAGLRSALNP